MSTPGSRVAALLLVGLALIGCAEDRARTADPFELLGGWYGKDYPVTPDQLAHCRTDQDRECLRLYDEVERGRAALLAGGSAGALQRTLAVVAADCDPARWTDSKPGRIGTTEGRCRGAAVALSFLTDRDSVAAIRTYLDSHQTQREALEHSGGPARPHDPG